MTGQIDLKTLERDSYRSTWDDGLLDLFAGLGLLGIGALWLTDYAVFGGVVPALLIPFWVVARRSITEPRAGYFRPSAERQSTIRLGMRGVLVLGVLMLALGVGVYLIVTREGGSLGMEEFLRRTVRGLPAILLALLAVISGLFLSIPRLFAYAAILVAAGAIGIWQLLHPGWPMAVSGLIVLLIGVALVVRFVRNSPILAEES